MAADSRQKKKKEFVITIAYPNGVHRVARYTLAVRLRGMVPDDTDALSPEAADDFVELTRSIANALTK